MSIENDLLNILEEVEETPEEVSSEELREKALSIQDPSEIGPDEYLVFLDYSIANIHNILRTRIKTKIPEATTIQELAKDAISLAIATYDLDIAKEANASFRTHLGWKHMQVVTDYAREYKKATLNELNTNDEEFAKSLEENKIQVDIEGNNDFVNDVDMVEDHNTSKFEYEQAKKVEWAMRQVRHELPRENNLILDVGIGEILKSDGSSYRLTEWAKYTNQDIGFLRKLFSASKRLVKQKMYRKGFMEIVVNSEKTTEDFLKDTDIEKQVEAQAKDEAIIESTDIKSLLEEAEEALSGDIDLFGEDDGK